VAAISVIVATCDRPARLGQALRHIVAAAAAVGGAPIVVADNGLEPAAAAAEAAGAGAIRYLRTAPRNKPRALNAAIAAAETDWLAFTDDDTLPDAEWLKAGQAFAARGLCRVFGGRIEAGPPPEALPAWMRPDAQGEYPGHGVFVRYRPLRESGLLRPQDPVPYGANFFARREVFREHGGYDERLWACCGRAALGAEDGELGQRLRRRGEPIGYCRETLVVHPVHAERCRWGAQLRLAFYYGWRDPLVEFDPHRPLLEGYRLRQLGRWTARALWRRCRGAEAAAFADALKAARAAGALLCRGSRAYRRRAAQMRRAEETGGT